MWGEKGIKIGFEMWVCESKKGKVSRQEQETVGTKLGRREIMCRGESVRHTLTDRRRSVKGICMSSRNGLMLGVETGTPLNCSVRSAVICVCMCTCNAVLWSSLSTAFSLSVYAVSLRSSSPGQQQTCCIWAWACVWPWCLLAFFFFCNFFASYLNHASLIQPPTHLVHIFHCNTFIFHTVHLQPPHLLPASTLNTHTQSHADL